MAPEQSKRKQVSVFGFLAVLMSRPRSASALIALVLWLVVSAVFVWMPPQFLGGPHSKFEGKEPEILSVDYWRGGWWRIRGFHTLSDIHFADPDHGWVVGGDGAILATADGGNTWVVQLSPASGWLNAVYFFDAKNGWVVGSQGVILATGNGGETWSMWSEPSTHSDLLDVFFTDALHGWVVGAHGTILATSDGGHTWTNQVSSSGDNHTSVHFTDSARGWIVGYYGTILKTTNGGETWEQLESTNKRSLYDVYFTDTEHGWAVGSNGAILATANGGSAWREQKSPISTDLAAVHFSDSSQGWAVGAGGIILATADGGKTWVLQNNPILGWQWLSGVHFSIPTNGWVVGSNGFIIGTSDGGQTWNKALRVGRLAFHPSYWQFSLACAAVLVFGLLGLRTPSRTDAISAMLSSDRPRCGGESDALGARSLAWALSRFLRHERTEPPLTLALNAPWGGGKSSLMNWLREDLERFGFRPAWFNAWHYEKQEQMFPALLETIRQQAVPPWLSWDGLGFRARLLGHRMKERPALTVLLSVLACFPLGYIYANHQVVWQGAQDRLAVVLEQTFPRASVARREPLDSKARPATTDRADGKSDSDQKPIAGKDSDKFSWLLGLFPSLAPLFGLWKGLQSFSMSGDWLGQWFSPTEQSKATRETAYRAQFAKDFRAVSSALGRTLVIFVDDLDRCQPKSVCEVMETLNFLASEGSCHMVLGIWREGVERAIGLGFADAAKEFAHIGELQTGSGTLDDTEKRRRYGQLYLEKLVNIWVAVPNLDASATQRMVSRDIRKEGSTASTLKDRLIAVKGWVLSIPARSRELAVGFRSGIREKARLLCSRSAWQGWEWARHFSRAWRFLIRVVGASIIGGVLFFAIDKSHGVLKEYLISIPLRYLDGASAELIYIFSLIISLWLIWRFSRHVFFRLLPAKPISTVWIVNLVTLALLLALAKLVFTEGASWSRGEAHVQKALAAVESAENGSGPAKRPSEVAATKIDASEANRVPAERFAVPLLLAGNHDGEILVQEWAAILVCLLICVEWLRFRLELPGDSPAFEESLQFWSPVLAKRFETPRRLKRFLNHLRFNAMRLRTLERPDPTPWEQFWNRYIRGEPRDVTREDELQGKESGLLLLSVLEACCGDDFATKAMLVAPDESERKAFRDGWEKKIGIDGQLVAELGNSWADELRNLLIERLKYYERNAMPQPTLADLRQFESLTPARITPKSVRTAGLSEQAAAWDTATERRGVRERRISDKNTEGRFVNDRRSGRERRVSHSRFSPPEEILAVDA